MTWTRLTKSDKFIELRRRAETLLQQRPAEWTEQWNEDIQRLVHELEVHQIELEMQNEELRQAQQELEAARDRYVELYDFAPVGYFTVDEDGLILQANLTGAAMLGRPKKNLIKRPLSRFIFKEDQDIYYFHHRQLFETGAPQVCELRLVKQDGAQFYGRVEATVTQADGAAAVCHMAISDVTRQAQAEAALKQHSERLEELVEDRTRELRQAQEQLVYREKMAALGQMAASVSHELRAPLTVLSNVEYLLRMTLPNADQTLMEYLDIFSAQIRRATKIITDLLQFSRPGLAEREVVAVAALLASALAEQVPPPQVQVSTRLAPDLSPLWIDPVQINQVLSNLIVNAYQVMPAGGTLTIKAKAEQDCIVLTVSDTGQGISPENKARVFEPFFTTKAKGIGLGLAICKSLVEANEGTIEVESEGVPGKGTTFIIRLRLLTSAQEHLLKSVTVPPGRQRE